MGVQISSPCLPETRFCDGTAACGSDAGMAVLARVVPLFTQEPHDSTKAYGALEVVEEADGHMYISKVPVPAGIELTDKKYWAVWNENVYQDLKKAKEDADAARKSAEAALAQISELIEKIGGGDRNFTVNDLKNAMINEYGVVTVPTI